MIGPSDLDEYYDLLKRKQEEYASRKSTELEPLVDKQVELIQELISVQTKIIAKLVGFKV